MSTLFATFGLVYVACILISYLPHASAYAPSTLIERIHFTIFFLPISLTYVSFYSLIEYDSPSLLIVRALADADPSGCSRAEIERLFQEDIIESRLRAAKASGLVQANGKQWALTRAGRFLGLSSTLIMRIYGIRDGG